ncbi:ammonium transporter [Novosphingobium nitrogenifigens DSM 19370]|uniref:Ammonium transporter n=1 Tax=Novosphingobium nitrogenifigens DSM 19370 TaxID=983920 RepID=F1Z947_9SPHN|nr:ammonium transporter [Novosphingobium nitrogenifigens]EGD58933.1 ammonium transporter [Novosphingobium nitrogenifigens DSM 19370]
MGTKPHARPLRIPGALLAVAAALAPSLAHAQVDGTDVVDSGDTALVLGASLIAMLALLPGIVLHHGGRLRSRAFLATATETGAIAAIVSLLFVAAGYTIAFGTVTNGWLGGGNAWMLLDLGNVRGSSNVPESAFAVLQLARVLFAATLLTGAWAERGNIGWIVPFTGLWSVMVYAPLAHWIWGGGWLASRLGTIDFSGGLVLHTCVGVSALVVTLLVGHRARLGRDGEPHAHAPGLALAGTGLVWVGLLALSAAGALAATDDAATALLNSQVGAASGALIWLLADALTGGKANPLALARGALVGLAATSAGANAVQPGSAMVLGACGVLVAWSASRLLRRLQIDDAVQLFSVHGLGGMTGAILTALFSAQKLGGIGYAAGMDAPRQLMAQIVGAGVVVAWSAIGTAIAGLMVAMLVPMRISEAAETAGVDQANHDTEGWNFD